MSLRKGRFTAPMVAMLRAIRDTGDPVSHLTGRAEFGAASQTQRHLRKRGLLVTTPTGARLTMDGEEALKTIEAEEGASK